MLSRLPQRQTEEMVLALAGKEMPGEVLRQVVAGADGVPLFVEELTKTVLESGLVRDQEHGYELAGPLRPLAIPATLQDSLMARLDRLGGAKSVAQLAAAIGREFSYEVLRAVSPLDEASLSTELARLVEAELVYQRGLPPAAQYIFKHALIQEAAYQSLLRTTRQGYHRRIAQVLAERFPQVGEIHPELMAHHYTEAGLAFEALPWWQRAGENAARRSASAEAIANLERGLALVPSVPDTPERARRELALLIALGPVFFGSHGFAAAETERVYRRAQELCDQLGDVPEVFPALWGQWGFSQIRGHSARAIEIAEQLLTLATASGDPELLVEAHHAMWATSVIRGAVAEGMEHIETGLALYDPEHHRSLAALYGGHDAASCGLAFGALALWVLGYPERAMERHRRAHGRLPGLNHPHTEANLHGWTALMLRCAGDFTGARAAAEVGLAVSTEHGLPQWAAMCLVVQGSARAALGDVEGGLAEMRRGVVGWRATRAVAFVPM
jgi:predicted ATPase